MYREVLGLAEQVAQAGRGSDGASVVGRGELTLILRPSGRTEWLEDCSLPRSEQPQHSAISPAHAALPCDVRSISKLLTKENGAEAGSCDDSLCLYQCDFSFLFLFEDYYIPLRGC